MDSIPWIVIALGLSTLACLGLGAWVLLQLVRQSTPRSPEERAELAVLPMTPPQRVGWLGLVFGLVQILAILWIFARGGGPSGYWDDDAMRLWVMGVFLLGIVPYTVLRSLAARRADERDCRVLSWGPASQAVAALLVLAAWCVVLPKMFHEQGAVPVVYLYLILGSVFLVHMTSYFLGLVMGSRILRHHGQG